jgi:hypothetical protein
MQTFSNDHAEANGWNTAVAGMSLRDDLKVEAMQLGLKVTGWTSDRWPYSFTLPSAPGWSIWRTPTGYASAYLQTDAGGACRFILHDKHANLASATDRVRNRRCAAS